MKTDNFVVIQGWMCNELNLKGNDLLVFALIYGFSQDGDSRFHGSRGYIADTFNISLPTVDKALTSLVGKELLEKHIITDPNGSTHNEYSIKGVVKKLYRGSKETLQGGSKETLYNNTNIEKHNDIYIPATQGGTLSQESPKDVPRFKKPTVEEVAEYVKSINGTTDPIKFVNYYESNGWMVGKHPMKNWKAAVNTWEQNNKRYNNNANAEEVRKDTNAYQG